MQAHQRLSAGVDKGYKAEISRKSAARDAKRMARMKRRISKGPGKGRSVATRKGPQKKKKRERNLLEVNLSSGETRSVPEAVFHDDLEQYLREGPTNVDGSLDDDDATPFVYLPDRTSITLPEWYAHRQRVKNAKILDPTSEEADLLFKLLREALRTFESRIKPLKPTGRD